jgi:hypothetical protein
VNGAPVANDDGYVTHADSPLTVVVPGVLANDIDPDGDQIAAAKVADPSHGSLSLNVDGSFAYTPAQGFVGHDSFTYKVSDGKLQSNIATANVTVINPVPSTTSISPTSKTVGDPGFNLTVMGGNFTASSVVRFNGAPRATTYVSSSNLTAVILAGDLLSIGTDNITVFNPAPGGGTSNILSLVVNAEGNPVPTTTSISPASKTVGDPGFHLTVMGGNFTASSVVRFNGAPRATTYVSSSNLTAAILAGDLLSIGADNITVFNPAPGGGTSNIQSFTVNPTTNPVPTTTSISPTSKTVGDPGFNLTVLGGNFTGASVVRFNGVPRATTYVSSSNLTVAILAGDLLVVGSNSITAFNPLPGGGTSNVQTFTVVSAANKLTRTFAASFPNPSEFGAQVTFAALVTSSSLNHAGGITFSDGKPVLDARVLTTISGGSAPTGAVTFWEGQTILGTVSLNKFGLAIFTTSSLVVGKHAITAEYSGDSTFGASLSSAVAQTVRYHTSTSIGPSVNPSVFGQSVSFTAAVAGSGASPTGTVTFRDGTTSIGTVPLVGNTAVLSTSLLHAGSHAISATYSGDSNSSESRGTVSQKVNKAGTRTTVSNPLNPSKSGQPVTFTVAVSVPAPGAGVPNGTVTFIDGKSKLTMLVLNGLGETTYTTSSLTKGSHSITAVYTGNADFDGSASPVFFQNVAR